MISKQQPIATTFGFPGVLTILLFATLLPPTQSTQAQIHNHTVEAVLKRVKTGKATIAVYMKDLATNEVLVNLNGNKPLIPASNMKVITTAAGLTQLGPDFEFTTELRLFGNQLIMIGGGDPGFGDSKLLQTVNMTVEDILDRMVAAVKRTRRTQFDTLVIDDHVFDQEFVHPTWPTDQLNRWYCAEVAGLNVNDNCLDVYATPAPNNAPPTIVTTPADVPIRIVNTARSGNKNGLWATRETEQNQITLRGEVKEAMQTPMEVTLHDPPMFLGKLLRKRLAKESIHVNAVQRIVPGQNSRVGHLLFVAKTPIQSVITRCNKDSQNLFAESILKRMGHQATGQPGGWGNGSEAVRVFLEKTIGEPLTDSIRIADGSGMSRDNRVSPEALTEVLAKMHGSDLGVQFNQSLSIAKVDGTMRRRFRSGNLKGTVVGKTGYIRSVSALSGYMIYPHQTIAFSIIFNGYSSSYLIDDIVYAVDKKIGQ